MFLVCDIPFRRLPIVTDLIENSKEVRGSEIFVSGITILFSSIGVVMNVSLAVGYVVSVLPTRVMRPVGFASISRMCIELIELITVRCAVLGRRNEELPKPSLLLRLLLVRRERRGR